MRNNSEQSSPRIFRTENVSLLFDSALPESLIHTGIAKKTSASPRIHIGAENPSPYVIHLGHEREENAISQDPIAQLESDLLNQSEFFVEEDEVEDNLEISIDALHHQLSELDRNQHTSPIHVEVAASKETVPEPSASPLPAFQDKSVIQEIFHTDELQYQADEPESAKATKTRIFPKPQLRLQLFTTMRAKALASFIGLSMLIVGPIHAMQGFSSLPTTAEKTTSHGLSALSELDAAKTALADQEFELAASNFSRAESAFSDAEKSVNELGAGIAFVASLIPRTNKTYDSVVNLIDAGRSLSNAAKLFSEAAAELNVETEAPVPVTEKLQRLEYYFAQILPQLEQAANALDHVDAGIVPEEHQQTIAELKSSVPAAKKSAEEFLAFSETLRTMLGDEMDMRYLLAFQNNTELRATGGFIGSFAQLDFSQGKIKKLHIPEGGTYDVQGQLQSFVEAPEPLTLINPRWEFHDANWFPDFPLSARKMLDFYEESGGPSVDGLIAINASILPEILAITGPIDLPKYDRVITSENVLFETQKIVEFEYTEYENENDERIEEAPKAFIGELAPLLLERIGELEMNELLQVADLFAGQLNQSEIQLYFANNDLQKTIDHLGWSGKQLHSTGDYLQIINSNIGGGKTDGIIDQTVHMQVELQQDGSIVNTLHITKTHRGIKSALFEGQNNVDYMRVYVPEGSELLYADGFEIPDESLFEQSAIPLNTDEDLAFITSDASEHEESQTDIWHENGKTVFGNWVQTKPGETQIVTISYELPFKIDAEKPDTFAQKIKDQIGLRTLDNYSLLIQKQSGVEHRETSVQFILPSDKTVLWSSHDESPVTVQNENNALIHYLIESF